MTRLTVSYSRPAMIQSSDKFIANGEWDGPPIVLKKYKLLLFTVPKVGCTVIKQFARRILGFPDWQKDNGSIPHDPDSNGIVYLSHFTRQEAQEMMTSPLWTRVMFIRDPKERFLSAYLDKVVNNYSKYTAKKTCCKRLKGENKKLLKSGPTCHANMMFQDFLSFSKACPDQHWNAQTDRLDNKFWPYINFMVHLETAHRDMEKLIHRVDKYVCRPRKLCVGNDSLWNQHGASGWGKSGNEAVFQTKRMVKHATNADGNAVKRFYDRRTTELVEGHFANDYDFELFRFNRTNYTGITNLFLKLVGL